MARLRRETDLKALAQNRHDLLMSKRNEIEEELKGLEAYLRAVGEKQGRGKPGRTTQRKNRDVTGPRITKIRSGRSIGAKGESATASILSLIERSERGISIDEMMKQTGLTRNTVNGILNRMRKERKVKTIHRGVYVRQNSTGQTGVRSKMETKKVQAMPKKAVAPQKKTKPKTKTPKNKPAKRMVSPTESSS